MPNFNYYTLGYHVTELSLNNIYPGNEDADIFCLTIHGLTNLPCLKETRDSLCKTYFQQIMETTHRLNYLLPCQRYKYDDILYIM